MFADNELHMSAPCDLKLWFLNFSVSEHKDYFSREFDLEKDKILFHEVLI